MAKIYESDIEEMAIEELMSLGYQYVSGPDIAPGTLAAERENYSDVLLKSKQNFSGKAMIVAMSRRIAAELYDAIISIRPEWEDNDLAKGAIKVVMTTSSSDGPEIQKHHTTKAQRKALALRMKDEKDSLKIVIVRDMWLTGFDAPCLNTMYIDKPMHEHNLMQAIARVNRVFKDKPGGLIVDYIKMEQWKIW